MASKEVVELQNILKKIKNLRSKIDSLNDSEEREKLFQQINSELTTLEKKVNKKANGFTNEMTKVEYEIMLLENKLKVLVYTVNDISLAKELEDMGVDGIFSDYPDLFYKQDTK